MRILIVARAHSVHTARWISQIADQGWNIHLFPSIDHGMADSQLRNIIVHHSVYPRQVDCHPSIRFRGIPVVSKRAARYAKKLVKKVWPSYRVAHLERLIKRLQPDIVHSMEIQNAGYLTLDVKESMDQGFPPWIVTNWGSDIYLFGRLREHVDRVRAVLCACDFYSCECQRDVQLAKAMGLRGEMLPVLPNTGGFDLVYVARFRQPGPTSSRRLILLKGYQHFAGRALVGVRALAMCASDLARYRVAIYSATPDVEIAAQLASQSTGVPIEVISRCPHDEMLSLYGQARIYIGLSISDAISTSLLEAMVMGAFPIQSCTSCADEWIVDGETGFIVPPEDPQEVAKAIRRALADDDLVDGAAERNAQVAAERLDRSVIQPQVIAMYEKVATRGGRRE